VTPRNLKVLPALPQYEAHACYFQDYLDFFFAPFFFFAMTLFLGFADELRQGWFKSRA
jgi:hypothetical protein